jgi:hypothetical protein
MGFTESNDNMINIFQAFLDKMHENQAPLIGFDEKIKEKARITEKFFDDEIYKVEAATTELINLLQELNKKIKGIIRLYQKDFAEQFDQIKIEHVTFCKDIEKCNISNIE